MDEGVDTGMILSQMEIPLLQSETATTLYQKVNYAHESLIQDLYIGLEKNLIKGYSQNDEEATYWSGRKPMDGELNNYMSMDQVDKLVRGTTKPYPGAYIVTNGLKTIIWEGFKSLDQINNPMYQEIHLTDGFFYGTNFEMVKY